MYQLTTGTSIIRLSDGATIPSDPANRDFALFTAWLEAGNEPEPAPAPPPPPPSYTAFWDALIASNVYASIRTQSMASLPMNTLATEFIALLGDAKAGRANEAAIQASMSAVFATGTFTEDDAEEFTAALVAGYLDDTYTLGAE
jgi:hypothetical protein